MWCRGDVGVKRDVGAGAGRRTVFAEDRAEGVTTRPGRQMSTGMDALADWMSEDSNDEDEEGHRQRYVSPEEQLKQRKKESRRRRLRAIEEREHDLTLALQEVENQRAKMSGNMGGVNKHGREVQGAAAETIGSHLCASEVCELLNMIPHTLITFEARPRQMESSSIALSHSISDFAM